LTGAVENPGENAIVPSMQTLAERESISLSAPMSRLPVEIEVSIPVADFRVRTLLALGPGQVIETQWAHDEDMPLGTRDVQLAWSEFEVIDTELAARITRLA
jgi:flagellar motor switch protein FliM